MAKQITSQKFQITNSYLNLIVGIIVVIVIAVVIVGFIRGRGLPTTPTQEKSQEAQLSQEQANLPAKHTVAQGEDLWKISEKYYKTGYNWVDIAKENNLVNPNSIAAGMELTIPNVPPKFDKEEEQATIVLQPTAAPATPQEETKGGLTEGAITGNSYTVVEDDNLWDIAVRAYGDGFKWVDIVKANNLANPDIIHKGNVFTLPR